MTSDMTSPDGIEIIGRFFEAIDELKRRKTIRGLCTFTNRYNINRWNLIKVRDNPGSSTLKPEYISYLVEGYGVSAEWILLGKGNMLKVKPRLKIIQEQD